MLKLEKQLADVKSQISEIDNKNTLLWEELKPLTKMARETSNKSVSVII